MRTCDERMPRGADAVRLRSTAPHERSVSAEVKKTLREAAFPAWIRHKCLNKNIEVRSFRVVSCLLTVTVLR